MITKLIFICTENMSQSPMAEAIFNSLDHDLDMDVISRGLVVLFSEPINPKATQVMSAHGIVTDHTQTRQFRPEEYLPGETLILTMNIVQKRRMATDFLINDNVFTIREFAGEHGDVLDPYGQDITAYEQCFEQLLELMKRVIYRLMYGKLPE